MMKQVDKVIKKGDYYQMDVADEGIYSAKTYKKEEPVAIYQSSPDSIFTNLPPFKEARDKYLFQPKNGYSNANPDQLLHQLEEVLINQKLADEDKQEILKLIREIKILKEEPLLPLVKFTPSQKIKEKEPKSMGLVELKIKVDISNLEDKVKELEKFTYPELNSLEHQLQVLLGQKKVVQSSQLPKDDRNKQDIDQLFSLLTSLTCANDISGLVDRINSNNSKFEEMVNWTEQLESTTSLHSDFLAELKEDELLLNKLEQNFKKNIDILKQKVRLVKEEFKK